MVLNTESTERVVSAYINTHVIGDEGPYTVREFIQLLETLPQDYQIKRGNLAHDGKTYHSMVLAGVVVEHGEVHII